MKTGTSGELVCLLTCALYGVAFLLVNRVYGTMQGQVPVVLPYIIASQVIKHIEMSVLSLKQVRASL